MSTLLFVYGTLKRGCHNHRFIAGQNFLGLAETVPGYRLYDLGGYPGLVARPDAPEGVRGEVWSVDDETLKRLDAFEGVHEGLYRREPVQLAAPYAGQSIGAYFSALDIEGRREIGNVWEE